MSKVRIIAKKPLTDAEIEHLLFDDKKSNIDEFMNKTVVDIESAKKIMTVIVKRLQNPSRSR